FCIHRDFSEMYILDQNLAVFICKRTTNGALGIRLLDKGAYLCFPHRFALIVQNRCSDAPRRAHYIVVLSLRKNRQRNRRIPANKDKRMTAPSSVWPVIFLVPNMKVTQFSSTG